MTLLGSPRRWRAELFPLLGANLIRARLIPLFLLPLAESLVRARAQKTEGTVAPKKDEKKTAQKRRELRSKERSPLTNNHSRPITASDSSVADDGAPS